VSTDSQLHIVEQFWQQLRAVDAGAERQARRRLARRRTLRLVALALLAALALVGAALAARAIFGSPAPRSFPSPFNNGAGRVTPGSVRLLSLRVPDPAGGPPWGMRVFATSKRAGCAEVGRVVRGRLVALGRDGAFGNDGLAHPLHLEAQDCGGLDAVGHLRFSALSDIHTASAFLGQPRCLTPNEQRPLALGPANARRYIRQARQRHDRAAEQVGQHELRIALRRLAHPAPVCSPAELRVIFLGALGPAARTITATAPGVRRVQRLQAADGGAYLLVFAGNPDATSFRFTVSYSNGLMCPLYNPAAGPHGQPTISAACARPPGFTLRPVRFHPR
jgi:hypothetical protein